MTESRNKREGKFIPGYNAQSYNRRTGPIGRYKMKKLSRQGRIFFYIDESNKSAKI